MVVNESRPFSSMFVTATPISSMWPTSASVGALVARAHARERRAQRVRGHLGECGRRLAPDARRLLFVARRARSVQQREQRSGAAMACALKQARLPCGR